MVKKDNFIKSLLSNKKLFFLFTTILCIAFFYRFYQLNIVPSSTLYGDEAFNGNDALRTIQFNDFKIFYPQNNGREPLLIWLIACVHSFLPPSIVALRLIPAIIGFLTVIIVPLCFIQIAKFFRITSKREKYVYIIALISSCFLAGSLWHINFSRIAFRAILDPFFASLSIYLLCLSLMNSSNKILAIFTGFVLGLGIYGYGTYKFLFPIVIILLLIGIKKYKSYKTVTYILASSFIVMLPLLNFIVLNHDIYFSRLSQISIFKFENPLIEFITSLKKLFLMLFWQGDANPRHNFNRLPQLHIVPFIFLAIELFRLLLISTTILLKIKTYKLKVFLEGFVNYKIELIIFLWFLIMFIPPALTYEGQPHSLRGIGIVIPVILLCGLGFGFSIYVINRLIKNRISRNLIVNILFFIVLLSQLSTYNNYFVMHPNSKECKKAFQLKANTIYNNFLHSKESAKLLVIKKENIKNDWKTQPLLYFTSCQPNNYNITILNIKEIEQKNLKNYKQVLCPRKFKNKLFGENVTYY